MCRPCDVQWLEVTFFKFQTNFSLFNNDKEEEILKKINFLWRLWILLKHWACMWTPLSTPTVYQCLIKPLGLTTILIQNTGKLSLWHSISPWGFFGFLVGLAKFNKVVHNSKYCFLLVCLFKIMKNFSFGWKM